jgi:general secretion pathway protein L
MHVIGIDIGSYSIKFIESSIEKKQVTHFGMREIVIEQYLERKEDENERDLQEVQLEIVSKYLSEVQDDVKVIFQAPNEIIINRFLELPIKNVKKAQLMIPFQLEENIPFSLKEIHMASTLKKVDESCHALVSFANDEDFKNYYTELVVKEIVPHTLTTETSCFESYFSTQNYAGAYMVLDIGHSTTKGYIFLNNKLISTHISYIAGKNIDEAISSTYKIDHDEAVIYKHQNCYFLTEAQYEEVDDNQKLFAKLMEQSFSGLLHDIKRWELGFRVGHGIKVSNIYICGGSSNIKNLNNFLTQKTGIKTQLLDAYDKVKFRNVDTDSKFKNKFNFCNLMNQTFKKGQAPINMLTGPYAQAATDDLPLHSISYISTRMAAVVSLACAFLLVEYFFLSRDLQNMNKALTLALKKNTSLNLTPRDRRQVRSNPEAVRRKIAKQHKMVKDEISTLQSALSINSIHPILEVSSIIQNNSDVWTSEINVLEDGLVEIKFGSNSVKNLEKVQDALNSYNLPDAFFDLDAAKRILKVEYKRN